MRKKGLLFVCFFGLIVTYFVSFPPPSQSGHIPSWIGNGGGAIGGMLGSVDRERVLFKDLVCGNTEGKVYPLEVIAPGRLIRQGFKDLKRGDVIYLQILNYDEDIFEICTETRLQCATFQLDDNGRMTRIDVPPVK